MGNSSSRRKDSARHASGCDAHVRQDAEEANALRPAREPAGPPSHDADGVATDPAPPANPQCNPLHKDAPSRKKSRGASHSGSSNSCDTPHDRDRKFSWSVSLHNRLCHAYKPSDTQEKDDGTDPLFRCASGKSRRASKRQKAEANATLRFLESERDLYEAQAAVSAAGSAASEAVGSRVGRGVISLRSSGERKDIDDPCSKSGNGNNVSASDRRVADAAEVWEAVPAAPLLTGRSEVHAPADVTHPERNLNSFISTCEHESRCESIVGSFGKTTRRADSPGSHNPESGRAPICKSKYLKKYPVGKGAYGEAYTVVLNRHYKHPVAPPRSEEVTCPSDDAAKQPASHLSSSLGRQMYVAKIIDLRTMSLTTRKYAQQEIMCLAYSGHFAIISYVEHAYFSDEGAMVLIMEHADRGDLHTYLKKLREKRTRAIDAAKRERALMVLRKQKATNEAQRVSASAEPAAAEETLTDFEVPVPHPREHAPNRSGAASAEVGSPATELKGGSSSYDRPADTAGSVAEGHKSAEAAVEALPPWEAYGLSEREAGMYFVQLMLGLDYIHRHRMIHRDIKAANIFLTSTGLLKLGDFGFSQQYDSTVSNPVANTFLGTPYYQSPEMWRGMRYGKKADIWAAGVILCELLTLRRPFEADNLPDLKQRVTAGDFILTFENDMDSDPTESGTNGNGSNETVNQRTSKSQAGTGGLVAPGSGAGGTARASGAPPSGHTDQEASNGALGSDRPNTLVTGTTKQRSTPPSSVAGTISAVTNVSGTAQAENPARENSVGDSYRSPVSTLSTQSKRKLYGVSDEMWEVVRLLLTVDPALRPSAEEVLRHPLMKHYLLMFEGYVRASNTFSANEAERENILKSLEESKVLLYGTEVLCTKAAPPPLVNGPGETEPVTKQCDAAPEEHALLTSRNATVSKGADASPSPPPPAHDATLWPADAGAIAATTGASPRGPKDDGSGFPFGQYEGVVFKESAPRHSGDAGESSEVVPVMKERYLVLGDGYLMLTLTGCRQVGGGGSRNKKIPVESILSVLAVSGEDFCPPGYYAFALATTSSSMIVLATKTAKERDLWLLKLMQAIGVE